MKTKQRLAVLPAQFDVITYEFENVPAKAAAFLAERKPVLPDPQVLETTQDRLIEKNFISGLKIATLPLPRSTAPRSWSRLSRRSACRGCSRRASSVRR
jgi:5-(carboxyamino)imidazole ribonucleotide synthase